MHDIFNSLFPFLVLYLVAMVIAQTLRRTRMKKAKAHAPGAQVQAGSPGAPTEPFLERVDPPSPSAD